MQEIIKLNKKLYKKQIIMEAIEDFIEHAKIDVSEQEIHYEININGYKEVELKNEYANHCLALTR